MITENRYGRPWLVVPSIRAPAFRPCVFPVLNDGRVGLARRTLYVKGFLVSLLNAAVWGPAVVVLRGYDPAGGALAVAVLGTAFSIPFSILIVRRLSVMQGRGSTRPSAARVGLSETYDQAFARSKEQSVRCRVCLSVGATQPESVPRSAAR